MNNIKIKNHRLLYAAIGFGFAICIMLDSMKQLANMDI